MSLLIHYFLLFNILITCRWNNCVMEFIAAKYLYHIIISSNIIEVHIYVQVKLFMKFYAFGLDNWRYMHRLHALKKTKHSRN